MLSADFAGRLLADVAGPLEVPVRKVEVRAGDPAPYLELTGFADGPRLTAPAGPLDGARAAAAVLSAYSGVAAPTGDELLTQRARCAGLRRNAPRSPGGACRLLPCADGWFALSLSRPADVDLVPALVSHEVADDPWTAVAGWLRRTTTAAAQARAVLLGLPGAEVPARPLPVRRPGVEVTVGGSRRRSSAPLVVSLAALWAGPLCASLLGRSGARVVCVESAERPDPSRTSTPGFHRELHGGHEHVRLDLATDRVRLVELLESATVVIEGSRPRALRQLGIDTRRFVEGGTIWCGISAYGRGGDDGARVGFGDDVAAGAGLVARHEGRPLPTGDAVADPLAGVYAAAAVSVALHAERGALLDVSMHDVCRSLG